MGPGGENGSPPRGCSCRSHRAIATRA